MVLIHGWPQSTKAWVPQVSVLRDAGYRGVTYDRRGFCRSAKSASDYNYDPLADDLQYVMDQSGLKQVTLVGFSMGGGEVARYVARHGNSRLHSVVFAAAVPPCLMQKTDNPEGPLTSGRHAPQDWRLSRTETPSSMSSSESFSQPTACCWSMKRNARKRSKCASSRRSMQRLHAWTRFTQPIFVKT
ncbi:MAG: alpha/beta hydrolase [Limnohabitans sp.]|uniref:alpha/beta hydrolase n=1 Tax=Limnohabitans sp. TaxID=1907725 RepID=UPI00391A85B5